MKSPRYATSRQKACQQCSAAKAKCDRKAGDCTRCAQRGLACTYSQRPPTRPSEPGPNIGDDSDVYTTILSTTANALPTPDNRLPPIDLVSEKQISFPISADSTVVGTPGTVSSGTTGHLDQSTPHRPASKRGPTDHLDFSRLDLVCPINVNDISNRWLNSYVPIPGQTVKNYQPSTTAYLFRILKAYASIVVRGRGVPPFIHSSQIKAPSTSPPLSTCLSLVRICERPLPGSETVASEVLQREMNKLYEMHESYDDVTLLAAFQAYLIYSMVVFFRITKGTGSFLRQAVMNLQELACASAGRGLVCVAEQQHGRPKWEAWIMAEANRRTLFTMYLFDSILSSQDNLPTFVGTELRGLPAPRSRFLWTAQSRQDWEASYNRYLAEWMEGGLRIDELWAIPPDLDDRGVEERRGRVDQWLEDVDEYGTMLYAITSSTHGD